MTSKVQATKSKTIKKDDIKLRSFCTAREADNEMKSQCTEQEKILARLRARREGTTRDEMVG